MVQQEIMRETNKNWAVVAALPVVWFGVGRGACVDEERRGGCQGEKKGSGKEGVEAERRLT